MKTALMSLVAVAVAGVPGVAAASTISVDASNTAVFQAASREANVLELVNAFGPLGFTDTGALLTAGAGCAAGPVVACDARDIRAGLGDRGDKASVNSFIGSVTLDAGTGDDDVLVGANTSASAVGGTGDDTIVVVSNGGGTATGGPGDDAVAGRSGGDDLSGDEGADLLAERPGLGASTLDGGSGADRLVGNQASQLFGGPGVDTLVGGSTLDGGPGRDRIKSLGGATVTAGSGNDLIDAGDGVAADCELALDTAAPALPFFAAAQADATALLAHHPDL